MDYIIYSNYFNRASYSKKMSIDTIDTEDVCFWYPGSEECAAQRAAAVVVEPDYMHTSNEVLQGQITYLAVALENVLIAALTEFYFRDQDYQGTDSTKGFYSNYDTVFTGSRNYWQYSNMLLQYSRIAIFSVAFITQLLAMLDMAAPINTQVWTYGVFMLMGAINFSYLGAMLGNYNRVTTEVLSSGNSTALIV